MMNRKKFKVGILGCGAIGSRIAKSIQTDLKSFCQLSGLYDIVPQKAFQLGKNLHTKNLVKQSFQKLIQSSDLIIEATAAKDTKDLIFSVLKAKKSILVMSVGKLLNAPNLFRLAKKNRCYLLLPSGAVSGLDALKAASLSKFSSLTLTTRKPLAGFTHSTYIRDNHIDLQSIKTEKMIFNGNVDEAVKCFPENINVAATIALASQAKSKMIIKIITSPHFKTNSHEIEAFGDFGHMIMRTDNVICPDNPKTSYLAVLSAIQTLKQFFNTIKIGT